MTDEPRPAVPVEAIPAFEGQISAIASSHAPFLYFDRVATLGSFEGVVRIALVADRVMLNAAGAVARDAVVVAHLRMPLASARDLARACEEALLAAAQSASERPN